MIVQVKVHHESLSQIHVQPKEKTTYDNKQTDDSITIRVNSDDRRTVQSSKKQPTNITANIRRTENTNTNNKLPTRNSYQSALNGNETVETVDLTVSQIPKRPYISPPYWLVAPFLKTSM